MYWIPYSRSTVRRALHNCSLCKRRRIKRQTPLMATLPKDLLQIASPFFKVGVASFGQTLAQAREALWVSLHLPGHTGRAPWSSQFIRDWFFYLCTKRICGKAWPITWHILWSTIFIGADRELKQSLCNWNESQIADFLCQKQIQWHFNPPASPHFDGIWERLVQSCKKALKVVLHGQVVTDEVLETAFAETEGLVNSRPLTEINFENCRRNSTTENCYFEATLDHID